MRRFSSPHRTRCPLPLAVAACLAWCFPSSAAPLFRTNDVIAFVGGASVVAADHAGLLETILTVTHPNHRLRFRCIAWEGDSVFAQPRELNFPSTPQLLRNSEATVVCVQFGSVEALDPTLDVDAFRAAYARRLDDLQTVVPRVIVVIPPPFEPQPPPLPDYTRANDALAHLARSLRSLALERQLPMIDLHQAFERQPPPAAWTHDGRELTPAGHRAVAAAWARELNRPALADHAQSTALWNRPDIAELHQAVSAKNRLWFHSWRPMNWAFLAGDRTEQQASRDHQNREIRWFPAEIQAFGPLITEAERRIESLAAQLQPIP